MMELSDFVAQSLVAIVRGVEKANEQLIDSPAQANPKGMFWNPTQQAMVALLGSDDKNNPRVHLVDFDVAVVATENESNTSGIGVGISVLGGNMTGTTSAGKQSESRIRFEVPLLLPIPERKPPFVPPPKTEGTTRRSSRG